MTFKLILSRIVIASHLLFAAADESFGMAQNAMAKAYIRRQLALFS
jgi:hypothetical protein